MATLDILESRIKDALSNKAKLQVEKGELMHEVGRLRDIVRSLEIEKDEVRNRLDDIIARIEDYLNRQG